MIKDDRIRLRHMIEAAHEAVSFARGRVLGDLEIDRQLVLALVKDIEIIGEAETQITEPTRMELADIPWTEIIAMRNRLVRVYFSINLDVLWKTVQQNLPILIGNLERVLRPESNSD